MYHKCLSTIKFTSKAKFKPLNFPFLTYRLFAPSVAANINEYRELCNRIRLSVNVRYSFSNHPHHLKFNLIPVCKFSVLTRFDFVFSENGLVGFHNEKAFPVQVGMSLIIPYALVETVSWTVCNISWDCSCFFGGRGEERDNDFENIHCHGGVF